MSCRRATQLISESRDRKLTCLERAQLRFHLTCCRACRRFRKQLATIGLGLVAHAGYLDDQMIDGDPIGGALSDEARERIRAALRAGR